MDERGNSQWTHETVILLSLCQFRLTDILLGDVMVMQGREKLYSTRKMSVSLKTDINGKSRKTLCARAGTTLGADNLHADILV